jgi:hypothetical protein
MWALLLLRVSSRVVENVCGASTMVSNLDDEFTTAYVLAR